MPNPMELRIGNDVITATKPDPDSPYRDFDFNSAGYLRLNDPGIDFFRQSGQLTGPYAGVTNPADYYRTQFGGGEVVTGSDGQQYFRPPNGKFNVVNQPLNYNPADTLMDNLGLYLVGGIVGAGALGLGGAAAGGAEAAGAAGLPESYWGMLADAGTGTATDAAVTGAGSLGGQSSGGWSFADLFGGNSLPPGSTTLGSNIFDTGSDPSEFFPMGGDKAMADGGLLGSSGGSGFGDLLSGGNLLNFAGHGLSGLLQFLGSKQAAEIQSQYGQQALALIAAQMAQNQANAQPWINAGTAGLNNAGGLLGLPGYDAVDFTKTPGYQFRYDEGMKQLQNQLRAGGNFYSGDALKGTQQYAQNFATNEFTNAFNRDMALAGMGQTSAANLGGLNTTGTNNAANMLTGIGNVEAAGRASGYNAFGNAIGGALNTYNQNNLLTALLGRGY